MESAGRRTGRDERDGSGHAHPQHAHQHVLLLPQPVQTPSMLHRQNTDYSDARYQFTSVCRTLYFIYVSEDSKINCDIPKNSDLGATIIQTLFRPDHVLLKSCNFIWVKNDQKSIFEQVHNQPVFKTMALLQPDSQRLSYNNVF